ncbi:MarR family winged helix-turn-helix transcriptional regulator [Neisseria sp. 83E34]|uniref:MarR family winged helix-turn-helix transcriptional regulator n=1 Tax=Neisseria sp. 83E34 TaxID=1692264 RepID=UPI0006CE9A67|nr:MarR family transcriptional regulator [Neisseria sp. 83E34]KPN71980.1 MarR family transcriptional regulator [Neisseria sp. 83E34]
MDTDTQKTQQDAVHLIVAQWQREMPALAAENMALIGRLKRCAALVQPELDGVFAEYGLSGGGFDVLATLRRAGSPYSLTPTELFASLMVTSGTMTTRLKNLEAQGLIRRLPNPEDARSMLVQLTESGKALIEEAVVKHVENEQRLLADVPQQIQRQLNEGLAALLQVWEKQKTSSK